MTVERKSEMYLKGFNRAVKAIYDSRDFSNVSELKKACYYGVMHYISRHEPESVSFQEATDSFGLGSAIVKLIGLLTPEQFMTIFPAEKEYNGKRWSSKDYFSTMEYVRSMPTNKPINREKKPIEFLWEYHNTDIVEFSVRVLCSTSHLRQFQGYPSIMKEWCDKQGITTYSIHGDQTGNHFLVNGITGKTIKLHKPRPQHVMILY